jgi:hypothetical protein
VFAKSSFSKFIALACTGSMVLAGTPAIGIITASGHFTLERSQVWGNSTLFEGALVETDAASSEVALRNGVKVQLGGASRARVWNNRIVLEKGAGQVAGPLSYEVDASGLKIRGVGENARLRVALNGRTEVTAMNGSARVTDYAGVLLASIPAGRTMSFAAQEQAGAGALMRTGCLVYKDGHFILQDENTQEVVEVHGNGLPENGKDLRDNVGNRVEVTGAADGTRPVVSGATITMNATKVALESQGGCLSVAALLNARTDVPAATNPGVAQSAGAGAKSGGISTATKIIIVAAVAGGGAGAALALAGKKSSTSP